MVKIKDGSTVDIKKDTPTTTLPFATTNNTMGNHYINSCSNNTPYNRRRNSLILSGIFLLIVLGVFYNNQGDTNSVIHSGVSNNGHNVQLRGLLSNTNQVRKLDEWESEDDDDDSIEDIDTAEEPELAGGTEDDEILEEEAELSASAKGAVSTESLDEEAITALDEDEDTETVLDEDLPSAEQPVDESGEDEDRFDINEKEVTTEAATTEELKEEALSKEEPINATELEQTTTDIGDLEDEIAPTVESTENNVNPQEESSTESVTAEEDEEDQSGFDEEIDKESEEIFDEIEEIDEEIEGVYKNVVCVF